MKLKDIKYMLKSKKFKKFDKSWNFIAIGDEPRKKSFQIKV